MSERCAHVTREGSESWVVCCMFSNPVKVVWYLCGCEPCYAGQGRVFEVLEKWGEIYAKLYWVQQRISSSRYWMTATGVGENLDKGSGCCRRLLQVEIHQRISVRALIWLMVDNSGGKLYPGLKVRADGSRDVTEKRNEYWVFQVLASVWGFVNCRKSNGSTVLQSDRPMRFVAFLKTASELRLSKKSFWFEGVCCGFFQTR